MYMLDGEPITWREFLDANQHELPSDQIQRAAQLQPGESMTLGGGAGAEFVLARVKDSPTTSAADPRGLGYEELRAQIASLKDALAMWVEDPVACSVVAGAAAPRAGCDCWACERTRIAIAAIAKAEGR